MATKRNKISKPRFNLKHNGGSKDPQLIYLIYRYMKDQHEKHIMLKYSTGMKIRAKNWDSKMYRAKSGVHFPEPDAKRINDALFLLENSAIDIVRQKPTIEMSEFKNELDYIMGFKKRPKSKEETTILEYFKKFILKSTLHDRTIQKFRSTKAILEQYEKDKSITLVFDMVNPEFAEHLAIWLYKTKKSSQNTVGKHLQVIKQVI